MMMPASTAASEHAVTRSTNPRRWVALVLLCVAQLMLVLDVTVVNVALPRIGAELPLHRAGLTWVMTAYTLAFGGLMLLGGRMADLFGARRMLLVGLLVFTIASLVSGLAGSATMLLGGRAAQGVGAAVLSPAALSLVTTTFTGAERGKALGVWAAVGGAGAAIGVVLGGVLTSTAGWRWVFFINVPMGVVVLLALPALVAAGGPRRRRPGVDVPGALIVTAATGAAIYGLINAGTHGWFTTSTVLPIVASVVGYALFAAVESGVRAPLIPVRLLARRPVAAGAFLMLVATGLLVGSLFLGSFFLQHGHGYSALRAGLVFLPIAVAVIAGAHTASRMVTRLDARVLAAVDLVLAAVGTGVAARWTSPGPVVAGLSVAALGIGAIFVTALTAALSGVAPNESGVRSGIVNTFHELGAAVGVAVLSGIAGASLPAADSGTGGFAKAFTASAIAAACAAVVAGLIVPAGRSPAGAAPHGH